MSHSNKNESHGVREDYSIHEICLATGENKKCEQKTKSAVHVRDLPKIATKFGLKKNYVYFSDEKIIALDKMTTEGCGPKKVTQWFRR